MLRLSINEVTELDDERTVKTSVVGITVLVGSAIKYNDDSIGA